MTTGVGNKFSEQTTAMHHLFIILRCLFWLSLCVIAQPASAENTKCLDLTNKTTPAFYGTLTFHILGLDGAEKGDSPEPTYILNLDSPICATGDDFADPGEQINSVQVFPEYESNQTTTILNNLRFLIGQRVHVEGGSIFHAHTAHHHAPLVLPITKVVQVADLAKEQGTAATTVRAFYLALAAGSGQEAIKFVTAEKRVTGPLSSQAITNFYKNLEKPLELTGVTAIGNDSYRVRYTFTTSSQRSCDGESVVQTIKIGQDNFVISIKALNGC